MPKQDPRIDAYIAKSASFARPILTHIRTLVHAACPDVVETMKWSFPHFMHQGMLCSMAAFKAHCTFGFWKGELVFCKRATADTAHGQFGRIASLSDLPADNILTGYIHQAAELNEAGIKNPPHAKSKVKKEIALPDYFLAVLKKNKKVLAAFENFSPSCKREYTEWVTEAKREETRAKRIKTAIKWMAAGKSRNWKYQ